MKMLQLMIQIINTSSETSALQHNNQRYFMILIELTT